MSDQRKPPLRADHSPSIDSTPADVLRALLERAELSQRGAARLLGIEERTMRMWCAGQGVAPTSIYRALDPRLTFSEYLRQLIDANEQRIEIFESGKTHELPRAYQPTSVEATKREIEYLRGRNEKYRSILEWQEAMDQMRDALSVLFQQSLTPGGFGLMPGHFQAYDDARQNFQSAMNTIDHVVECIHQSRPFPSRHKLNE